VWGGQAVAAGSFDDGSLSVHVREKIAEGLGSHVACLTKLGKGEGRVGADESFQNEFVAWRANRFLWGWGVKQAKSELILSSLKNQRQVGASGGGAMLDGERELIRFSPEVEVRIAPGMKLGASAQGLTGAEMVCGLSGVMDDDHGEAEQTLEFAEVGEDGGDIGRSVFVDAMQANEWVEE